MNETLEKRLAAIEQRLAHIEQAIATLNERGLPEQVAAVRAQVRDLIAAAASFADRSDG